MGISITKGDLIHARADAVVHVVSHSVLSGGADSEFYQAAGPELYRACTMLGICLTGEAKITEAYKLPAKFVIHTHAPVWLGGTHNEAALLAKCYESCLKLADENQCDSIAFPPISTGSYRCPPEKAASIAMEAIAKFLRTSQYLQDVLIICKEDSLCAAFAKRLEALEN